MLKQVSATIAILGIAWLWSGPASANDRVDVCATYVNSGASYHVPAISTTGYELNNATSSMRFNVLDHYVVIFWQQNHATVIDVGAFPVSGFPTTGTDQAGREWRVVVFFGFC